MREIKFRWWNGQKMISHDDIQTQVFNLKNMTLLMQYTGLKDKNGVEIYENDVIDKKYKWVIEFRSGSFWAIKKDTIIFLTLSEVISKREKAGVPVEIIGNIHENPELISD